MADWPSLGRWPASCLRAGPSRPNPAPCPPPRTPLVIVGRSIGSSWRRPREICWEPLASFGRLLPLERLREAHRMRYKEASDLKGGSCHGESVEVLERGMHLRGAG